MADREQVRARMKQDGIEFIVVQFVDIHGAAKAKLVPVSSFDAMIDVGAGFAGCRVGERTLLVHRASTTAPREATSSVCEPCQPPEPRLKGSGVLSRADPDSEDRDSSSR